MIQTRVRGMVEQAAMNELATPYLNVFKSAEFPASVLKSVVVTWREGGGGLVKTSPADARVFITTSRVTVNTGSSPRCRRYATLIYPVSFTVYLDKLKYDLGDCCEHF